MDITMREEAEKEAAQSVEHAAEAGTVADGKAPAGSDVKPAVPGLDSKPTVETFPDATLHPPAASSDSPMRTPSPSPSRSSTPRPGGIPTRLAIAETASTDKLTPSEEAQMTEEEKKLREKQKKKGLTKEQREELAAYELERKKQREERVKALGDKLIDRLNVWTETDKDADVTAAFKAQVGLDIENLKMESFGIEILHAIGATYLMKATSFLKSQKLFGLSGLWSRMKEKGTLAKETWTTISTAIDAQVTMEEMVRLEERGGDDWTDERKAEYEKRVTGKILAAAWRGSKFEIQGVLREVCEKLLNDKNVRLEKRIERAQGLAIIGDMFAKVSTVQYIRYSGQRPRSCRFLTAEAQRTH
jgi:hypothetical protein